MSLLPSVFEEPSACASICPQLTYTQRLIGFCLCAALGYVLALVGTLTLIGGPTDENIRTFVILYVAGNVIALGATGFLIGPKSQCTKMVHPTRRWSTAFYFTMLIVVFVVAYLKQNIILVLFLLGIEVLAAMWYSLSYVPGGRMIVCGGLRRIGIFYPCFATYDAIAESLAPKKSGVLESFTGPEKTSSNSIFSS